MKLIFHYIRITWNWGRNEKYRYNRHWLWYSIITNEIVYKQQTSHPQSTYNGQPFGLKYPIYGHIVVSKPTEASTQFYRKSKWNEESAMVVPFRFETDLSQARDTNMNYLSMNRITCYTMWSPPVWTCELGLHRTQNRASNEMK